MDNAERERFRKRLASLAPTEENIRRVAEARGRRTDERMSDAEVLGMTAEFVLLETDDPSDPGGLARLAAFFETGNADIPDAALGGVSMFRRKNPLGKPGTLGAELVEAARTKNTKEMLRLLAAGADLNAQDSDGWFFNTLRERLAQEGGTVHSQGVRKE